MKILLLLAPIFLMSCSHYTPMASSVYERVPAGEKFRHVDDSELNALLGSYTIEGKCDLIKAHEVEFVKWDGSSNYYGMEVKIPDGSNLYFESRPNSKEFYANSIPASEMEADKSLKAKNEVLPYLYTTSYHKDNSLHFVETALNADHVENMLYKATVYKIDGNKLILSRKLVSENESKSDTCTFIKK